MYASVDEATHANPNVCAATRNWNFGGRNNLKEIGLRRLRLVSMAAVVAGIVLGMGGLALRGDGAEAAPEDDILAMLEEARQAYNADDYETFLSFFTPEGAQFQFFETDPDLLLPGQQLVIPSATARVAAVEVEPGAPAPQQPPRAEPARPMAPFDPGGRTILEAVSNGLELRQGALSESWEILRAFGNMSSATIMFVLEKLLNSAKKGARGCGMSFGPGLAAETMRFHMVG